MLVLDHQDVNDVLQNILNRLDIIEKEIGIKPTVDENIIAQLGITAKEFQEGLMQLAQSYKYIAENYGIEKEDWSWLDKDDINE